MRTYVIQLRIIRAFEFLETYIVQAEDDIQALAKVKEYEDATIRSISVFSVDERNILT